ncbi:MAG: hypothetical protein NBV76_01000 [Candidatus Ochrobactrum gambitense]|nr:MAG: hypothetical protein NBV76_01000 [Candidatus Ochrobactrum gambitense]WEK15815.1 MAG: hypothetical protein P0Y54_09960 [Candidatus Ochrobactrum gambitense]
MGKYIYDIRDCDVTDRVSLQTFRQKREQWSTWLDDDPDHAIWNVIHTLVWRDTNFAAISKLALENPTGPLHTTLIGETLVSGHVTMQVMALRRLIDRRKDVISLPRLITDLKANWQLLTRENFVCFDGLPYDYEAAAREFWKDKKPEGAIWVDTTGPLAYGTSERLHRHFDRLAGISPTDRKRHDVLPRTLIATVERWLLNSRAMDVAEWSHVHVAHAANAQNREAIAHVQVTNNTISAAIREIARVAEAISGEILYIGGRLGALMPIAQYDIFDRLERPIASTPIRKVAEEAWDAKTQEWDEAVRDVADDLLK